MVSRLEPLDANIFGNRIPLPLVTFVGTFLNPCDIALAKRVRKGYATPLESKRTCTSQARKNWFVLYQGALTRSEQASEMPLKTQ